MRWYVIRHPDTGGVACVSEDAVDIHSYAGWTRVAGPLTEDQRAQFDPATWVDPETPEAADEAASSFAPDDRAEPEEN